MKFLSSVILAFSMPLAIFANVLNGQECDVDQAEVWLGKSQQIDFAACKQSCKDNAQCQSVTFYDHGSCSLFSTRCEKTKPASNAQSELVKELTGLFGQECDVDQGEIFLVKSQQADFAACKKKCENDAGCQSVTFYHHGACSLFATTCDKTKTSSGANSAFVQEIELEQEQCEIDGTCQVARGEECDRTQGEEYLLDGSGNLNGFQECKQACMDTTRCQSITYYHSGWCSLFQTQCQHRKPSPVAVSVTLKADFFNKQECDADAGEVFLSASSGDQADLEACQKSCEDAPECKSTTYFKSGYCSHFSTCCNNRKPSATGNADAVKTAQCVNACLVENGGCDSKRECTSTDGVATCGDCPAPLVNDGATDCKEPAPPKPPKYWLEDGCRTTKAGKDESFGKVKSAACKPTEKRTGRARFAEPDQAVGGIQCCNDKGKCTRKDAAGKCISGDGAKGELKLYTYFEAKEACAKLGKRLCTKAETRSKGAAGCCATGCWLNCAVVWTSDAEAPAPPAPPKCQNDGEYWLEDGCSKTKDGKDESFGKVKSAACAPTEKRTGRPRFAKANQAVGEIQCCSDKGKCTRLDAAGECISGDAKTGDKKMYTYCEAKEACARLGKRLCTKAETRSKGAAGCCHTGCYHNCAVVWTSDPAPPKCQDDGEYWLEDGCSKAKDGKDESFGKVKSAACAPTEAMTGRPRFAKANQAVGEIQCCSDKGKCTRLDGAGECISGDAAKGDKKLYTYCEARDACARLGKRLCTKAETRSKGAAGCCHTGCWHNCAVVWTSDAK